MLYPLSYGGVDEIVSHRGYHVVENLAYDQRDQRDAGQREHDQQAEATHHYDLLVVHVSPLGRKRRKPPRSAWGGFLLIGGACYHDSEVFTQAHPIILPLVVDLLAREDHVRVGNTVLVGKANVVTAPTDLLRDAGQRVTGLDDIAAVTGGLHA